MRKLICDLFRYGPIFVLIDLLDDWFGNNGYPKN